MDRYELRRLDYSLSEDHIDVQSAYRQFFKAHCSIDVVRAAEASGFDKSLWERLCGTGASTMALPESAGGDGATMVDLTLVAEEIGRAIAPVPWIDHVCATRLLAELDALPSGSEYSGPLVSGELLACLDPRIGGAHGSRLLPSGSIADHIIINGTIKGSVSARLMLELQPNARIEGDVEYGALEMHQGALIAEALAASDKNFRRSIGRFVVGFIA